MKNFIVISLFFIGSVSLLCKPQKCNTLNGILLNYFKYDPIDTSMAKSIEFKNIEFKSAISFLRRGNQKKELVIVDDKSFNYDFFKKNNLESLKNQEIILTIDKVTYKDKVYLIAKKISK